MVWGEGVVWGWGRGEVVWGWGRGGGTGRRKRGVGGVGRGKRLSGMISSISHQWHKVFDPFRQYLHQEHSRGQWNWGSWQRPSSVSTSSESGV